MSILNKVFSIFQLGILAFAVLSCNDPLLSQSNSTEKMNPKVLNETNSGGLNDVKNEKIKIEVWSDVVCPFCYMGKKKLEQAVKKLNAEGQVEIVWNSFQLDPTFPKDSTVEYYPYLSKRTGYTEAQLKSIGNDLNQAGQVYGIEYNFGNMQVVNTLDLHRLLTWSKQFGLNSELKEAFMAAYFTDNANLSDDAEVLKIIDKVGLNVAEAKKVLETDAYAQDVQNDINRSNSLGIQGVPYFLINGKQAISGAQDDSVFEKVISAALEK